MTREQLSTLCNLVAQQPLDHLPDDYWTFERVRSLLCDEIQAVTGSDRYPYSANEIEYVRRLESALAALEEVQP